MNWLNIFWVMCIAAIWLTIQITAVRFFEGLIVGVSSPSESKKEKAPEREQMEADDESAEDIRWLWQEAHLSHPWFF